MRSLFLRWSVAAMLILGMSGCATAGWRSSASVSLVSARPVASTVFESTVELLLRVTNSGDTPITIGGGSHALAINGGVVGRGVSNARVTVPAFSSEEVPVTVYVENLSLLRRGRSVPRTAAVSYEITSRWAGLDGTSGFSSKANGTLDLRGLMDGMELDWSQLTLP